MPCIWPQEGRYQIAKFMEQNCPMMKIEIGTEQQFYFASREVFCERKERPGLDWRVQ